MGIVKDMFLNYSRINSKEDSVRFALRLLGFDDDTIGNVMDEEVWRTSEEGKHFKFETSTGEIKAGFGGKFNGKRLGETFGQGHARAPIARKSSGGEGTGVRRGYWMHNLPESRMLGAAKMMSGIKRDLRNAEIRSRHAYKLFSSGMITAQEYEKQMKPFGLENFSPNMSPEAFTMKCGKPEKKAELLSYMSEAKEWDKKADQLTKEKWSGDDFKLAAALADKYGVMEQFKGEKIPDDSSLTDKWDEKDLNCWYDLKSKALGGPSSGKEAPDELQIKAGLKEAPQEPAVKADYDWYRPLNYGGNMEAFVANVAGKPVSYGHKYTKEEFAEMNQQFLDQVKYGKISPNQATYYGVSAVGAIRQRMGLFGDDKPTSEMLSRLSDSEKRDILNMVNMWKDYGSFSSEPRASIEDVTFKDMDQAEKIIARLNMKNYRSAEKLQPFKDYILAQEKMLIGAEPSNHNTVAEGKEQAKRLESEKKAEEKRQKEEQRKKDIQEWMAQNSPEDIQRMYHPESVAGVTRRNEGDMSHDEADNGKANPLRDVVKDPRKRGNCQTCVVAYAMRRRGYDVEAKLRNGDAESYQTEVAKSQNVAWKDPETGKPPEFEEAPDKRLNAKSAAKWINETVKPGQMFTFSFCWSANKVGRGAHVIIVEKRGNDLVFFDPQINPKTRQSEYRGSAEVEKYLGDVSYNSTSGGNWRPRLLRIDNALPNMDYCDKILQKATT